MSLNQSSKKLAQIAIFDPKKGRTVIEPLGDEKGWWAGAPSVVYSKDESVFYCAYRLRKPRELGRGTDLRIAKSSDGEKLEEVWRASKGEFNITPSVERAALVQSKEGTWLLYVSYVDPVDDRWRVDYLEAKSPDSFDPATAKPVFTAGDISAEGVKDPWVVNIGELYHMILSYAPTPEKTAGDMHSTADVYNTGLTKSHTGLATSADGRFYVWQGDILSPPESGWDSYATRLGCALYIPPVWMGFYDGSASVKENYEERCGLAVSHDFRTWQRTTLKHPWIVSPNASGSLPLSGRAGL